MDLELESRHITKFEINLGGQRQGDLGREERGRKDGEFNLKISADGGPSDDRPLLNFTVEITIGGCSAAFSLALPFFVWKKKMEESVQSQLVSGDA